MLQKSYLFSDNLEGCGLDRKHLRYSSPYSLHSSHTWEKKVTFSTCTWNYLPILSSCTDRGKSTKRPNIMIVYLISQYTGISTPWGTGKEDSVLRRVQFGDRPEHSGMVILVSMTSWYTSTALRLDETTHLPCRVVLRRSCCSQRTWP